MLHRGLTTNLHSLEHFLDDLSFSLHHLSSNDPTGLSQTHTRYTSTTMIPSTIISLSIAATIVLALNIPDSVVGPSPLYPTVQLAVIPENHISEGTISARDYTVEVSLTV